MKTISQKLILSISAFVMLFSLITPFSKVAATEVILVGPDLHKLWDSRCLTCHGHSAEFSRQFLKVVDGKLQGRLFENNFRLFLNNHYLAGKEVDSVYAMLMAQNSNDSKFDQDCSGCHQSAAEFVRETIIIKDGEIYSKEMGIPISSFLASHRRLNAEEVDFHLEQLTRVATEIYRPETLDTK